GLSSVQVIPSIDLKEGRSRVVFWPGVAAGTGSPTDRPERIARRFVELGLVAKDLSYDGERRRAVKAYRVVLQPVGRHRPLAPSLMYLAHVVSERWNEQIGAPG
ncbi:MAG: hypothetical protein JRN72_04900, partial [Nitrososphaerota archaeon]|nr:hypothetical protein [Nitrososphaerota archaeon]